MPIGDAENSSVEPAGLPAQPAILESAECPACHTMLRRVSAEPGARIRCLNCGHKFIAVPVGGNAVFEESVIRTPEGAPAIRAASLREPPTAGYWLLRIPAIIFFAGASFLGALLAYLVINELLTRQIYNFYSQFFASIYIPLLPLSGVILFLLTRSLSKIDGNGIRAAWRAGILTEPIPAPRASSLPYVLPLAVFGGVLPIIVARVSNGGVEETLISGLYGALLFYMGFAIDDLRQFIWRQENLAKACLRAFNSEADLEIEAPVPSGLLPACVPLFAALAMFCGILRMWEFYRFNNGNQSFVAVLMTISIALIFFAGTIYLLGRSWGRASKLWERAALETRVEYEMAGKQWTLWKRTVVFLPVFWTGFGLLWFALILAGQNGPRGIEIFTVLFACASGACFALWLSYFLRQAQLWVHAQALCMPAKEGLQPPLTARQPFLYSFVFWFACVISAVQTILFAIMLSSQYPYRGSSIKLESIIAFPLLLAMLHYPAIWLAFLLREFLNLEIALNNKVSAPMDAG